MLQETKGNAQNAKSGQGLAIAGLVLGTIALMFAFIPCLGLLALLPGVVGLILSAISTIQYNKSGQKNPIAMAGIVCSVIACCIAVWQFYILGSATNIIQTYQYYEQSATMDSLGTIIQTLEAVSDTAQKSQ